ncbi:pectin lyase fold/virulence factor [Truncatella angustata]|uniref:Pectin lyase fold/virulence factor n=1 Tax=Truncatella angustata TaxID=152316 RepID=A0A9P8RFG3_9PEZI|nr:pectin lyase fold/virulence factor [Truncatella angustata]KAH6643476.1 pectin lyase fold/virulence factor [Truncatella angustata]
MVIWVLSSTVSALSNSAFIQEQPIEVNKSTTYEVLIRANDASANGTWTTVPLYSAIVAEINATTRSSKKYSTQFGVFDYDGTVQVSVTPNPTIFPVLSSVRIRPLSYGILPDPCNNIVVEVNDDIFNVVHLFTSEIETDPIAEQEAANRSDLVYYGPGYHELPGQLNLTSGQTLVAGTAVSIVNASDIAVRGRGFLSAAISIQYSSNIIIDGAFVSTGGFLVAQSQLIHARGWRSITSHQWGDGMDIYCSQDVLVEKVFIRSSDDCIALYQHRNDWWGNSSNITVRDPSLWADIAHPINVGTHGNPLSPETMDGVTFRNIDILDQREPQINYEGTIAFSIGDENSVQNVEIDDIRSNNAPGRGLKIVTVKDMAYNSDKSNGHTINTAAIYSYAEDCSVDFVDFQGLTINGLHVWDNMTKPSWYVTTDYVPAVVGSFVNNLTFSA